MFVVCDVVLAIGFRGVAVWTIAKVCVWIRSVGFATDSAFVVVFGCRSELVFFVSCSQLESC